MAASRWSELFPELLETIEGHIVMYDDKIRFRCVCTHFDQSLTDLPDLRQPQPAWLLMPYKTGPTCGLYHPFENKVFDIDLLEAGDKVFIGNGHGWVVTTQPNGSIDVLNPLTRARVPLPPRYKFPDVVEYNPDKIGHEYTIRLGHSNNPPYVASLNEVHHSLGKLKKVVISSSPLSGDFIAVALHPFGKLSYYKSGDGQWRDLVKDNPHGHCEYHDVTFFGGKLCVVSSPIGELMICDDFCSSPRLRKCDNVSPIGELHDCDCLANSSDHVVMARRVRNFRSIKGERGTNEKKIVARTVGFDIWKLNVCEEDTTRSYWVGIESLGDDEILFTGLGTRILVSSRDYVGKGNRIYFTSDSLKSNCGDGDGDVKRCFDNGVVDLEDRRVKPLGYECSPRVIWPSPVWFTPNPY